MTELKELASKIIEVLADAGNITSGFIVLPETKQEIVNLLATARAEGAAEERERIKGIIALKKTPASVIKEQYDCNDFDEAEIYELENGVIDEVLEALTTKEHHAS